jgi:6,7-dimethyl-8-ribityllumazine synthase
MASKEKNLSEHKAQKTQHSSKHKIGIVVSSYHDNITSALLKGCRETLIKFGVNDERITVVYSPGAYELPLAAELLYINKKCDAVICLGCVIKGDTAHDVYINHAVADALMQLGIKNKSPFVFGLLTTNNLQQAKDRAGGKHGNKGIECAIAALQMLDLKTSLKK